MSEIKQIDEHSLGAVLALGTMLGLAGVATVLVIRRLRQAVAFRRGDTAAISHKRQHNKHWNNRLITTVGRAGKRLSPFALIEHVGRRSGASYQTPIRVVRQGPSFLVGLTYGPTVDWFRNVEAAGTGKVVWQGQTYSIGRAEPVAAAEGIAAFPLPSRFLFWLDGAPPFVRFPII
jgi:deazaflavin-dependent oxidoreductase (nitroreductase family)